MKTAEKQTSHTPGPWQIKPVFWANHPCDPKDTPKQVASWNVQSITPNSTFFVDGIHREEDAHLVAAAPELLEALQHLLRGFLHEHEDCKDAESVSTSVDSGPEFTVDLKRIRAAIAKATGGAR